MKDVDEVNYDIKGRLPFSWPKTPFQANLNYLIQRSIICFCYGLSYQDNVETPLFDENVDEEQLFGNEIELLIGSVTDRFIGTFRKIIWPKFKLKTKQVHKSHSLQLT